MDDEDGGGDLGWWLRNSRGFRRRGFVGGEECEEDFGDGERSVFVTDDESERFGE